MRSQDGFTLIELMIVVVIIGILAAIAIPKFSEVSRHAKEAEAGPILKQIYTLQERYKQANDHYAGSLVELEGGAAIVTTGKYFTFIDIDAGHASGFCATAQPSADGVRAGVQPRSIDGEGKVHASAGCV